MAFDLNRPARRLRVARCAGPGTRTHVRKYDYNSYVRSEVPCEINRPPVYIIFASEASTLTKSMAAPSILIILLERMCVLARKCGWPVKYQRSLKKPRKRLIPYITLSGKIATTAMGKELNTRQDVLLVQLGRTKLLLTASF